MVTLYYPAILGAGFFVIVIRSVENANVFSHPTFWLAVAITAYFSISYLVTDAYDEDNKSAAYSPWLFCFDAIEALLLLAMFSSLGFAETSQHEEHMWWFCVYLMGVAMIQMLWYVFSGKTKLKKEPKPVGAFVSALVIGLYGLWVHSHEASLDRLVSYADWILAIGMGLMALLYFKRAEI
jgi:hypothetical protein